MHFEDYNYEMYNRHLLINPDIDDFDDSAEDSDNPKDQKLGFMPEAEQDDEAKVVHLTDKVIEQSVHESYKHSHLDV